MFESIIAKLLNKYLSEYIDAVDYKNLKIGLFSGYVELLNIKVKPSALYQFDLPVEVKYGTIGKLKINLSWRKILSEAAVLEIEDLYVLCGPFEDKIHDPNKIEEIHAAHKRKKLAEIEKLDEAEFMKGLLKKQVNFLKSYLKKITFY
jgi:vacuolar protein sorting-associated protein 13A/C